MARIQILAPALASQIAAGEVVERPASAAKELIENAIDAQASRCDVGCSGGGIEQLSVRDDGIGMTEEDAALCVERHATSKLRDISDLNQLATFGFRGEALPSIASVSRFTLRTRSKDHDHGCCVDVEAGKTPMIRREGMPIGTTVIIKDLFFNVPARRKFLRSTGTESAHITAAVEGAALARPDVTFTLERDGRKVRELLRTASRRERVLQLLGEEPLTEVRGERGPLRFEAHLSGPERARSGAQGLWLLVNGRVIRDRMIAATVAQAYGGALSSGTYPRGVVYIDLPSELVDVNVHPQKSEVRFVDPRALSDAVFAIVSRELSATLGLPVAARGARNQRAPTPGTANLLPVERGFVPNRTREVEPFVPERRAAHSASGRDANDLVHAARHGVEPHRTPADGNVSATACEIAHDRDCDAQTPNPPLGIEKRKPTPSPPSTEDAAETRAEVPSPNQPPRNAPLRSIQPSLSQFAGKPATALLDQTMGEEEDAGDDEPAPATMLNPPLNLLGAAAGQRSDSNRNSQPELNASASEGTRLRLLAQVRLKYLVCESDAEGIVVVDQHAADECVVYANYRANYEQRGVRSEALLFPTVIEVSTKELACVESQSALFGALGFDLRVRGKDRVSIHATPRELKRAAPEELLRVVLAELLDPHGAPALALEHALRNMACLAAIRAGEILSDAQAQTLLLALCGLEEGVRSKHGSPILSQVAWAELERASRKR
ncbi:MAG TPA: DNA mismatch repair endonuclease MutL [Polyangiaceae bacterium]|nr:DNA mismatch repair endonuclease MutL [Polyangiaceae bacterium]